MASDNEAFAAGFDVVPDITTEDLLQDQFNTEMSEVAESLDELMSGLNGVASSELSDISTAVADIRVDLFDTVDIPLQEMQQQAGDIMLAVDDVATNELGDITEDVNRIAAPFAAACDIPPPADPWNGQFLQACLAGNATFEERDEYMTELMSWLIGISVDAHNEMRDWYHGNLEGPCTLRTMMICGQEVTGYSGGREQAAGNGQGVVDGDNSCGTARPESELQEMLVTLPQPTFEIADVTNCSLLDRRNAESLTMQSREWLARWFPSRLQEFDAKLTNDAWGMQQPIVTINEGFCTLNVFAAKCGSGKPIRPPIPVPEIEPPVKPPPIPQPDDWVARLCECLNKDTRIPQDVYVNCDTCEVKLVESGNGDLEPPWLLTVKLHGDGRAEYVAQCDTTKDDIDDAAKEIKRPEIPENIEALMRGMCEMPKALHLPADAQNKFSVASFSMSVAFAALSIVPQNVLVKIKPDGALIGLAALFGLMGQSADVAAKMADKLECGPEVKQLLFSRQFMAFFERLLPGGFQEQIARQTQQINELCPSLLPTVDQAHRSYLRDEITLDEWGCWIRSNGYTDKDQQKVMRSGRTKLGITELNTLLRRNEIDFDEYLTKMRGIGVLDVDIATMFFSLSEQRRGMQDIIRFMVRDVDDDVNIDWSESDNTFVQKFGGQLRRWAEDQGVPELVAKYAWRAHWIIPSPTQLFEMFHRLGRDPDGNIIQSFEAEVKTALQQQDILPKWVDNFLKISFRLPTRVDVRRAYRMGFLTEQEVFEQYVKQGYTTEVCTALTKFSTREKLEDWANHKLVKLFERGELTEPELRTQLSSLGATQDAIDFAVNWGRGIQITNRRRKCLAAIKRKVFIGELNRQQAVIEAGQQVQDQTTVLELVDGWFCERDAGSREITVRQVLRLFREQVIDSADLFERLVNLRYSPQDAAVLVDRATAELTRIIEDKEKKRLAKAQRDAERAARDAARTEQRRLADVKRTEKAREAAKKASDRRENRIMEAAKQLSNRMNVAASTIVGPMMTAYRSIARAGIIPSEQVSQAAVKAAGDKAAVDLLSWESIMINLAESTIDSVSPDV